MIKLQKTILLVTSLIWLGACSNKNTESNTFDSSQINPDTGCPNHTEPVTAIESSTSFVELTTIDMGKYLNYTPCSLSKDGKIWCWGLGDFGILGSRKNYNGSHPVQIDTSHMDGDKTFKTFSVGSEFGCGVTMDGNAWCWGEGKWGKLGSNSKCDSSRPVPVDVSQIAGDLKFEKISSGDDHTCAIAQDGAAWCWGHGSSGELGDGSLEDKLQPTKVDTSSLGDDKIFVEISAGTSHTCGITEARKAWCWGTGDHGELGNGTRTLKQNIPVQVDVYPMADGDTTFKFISAGSSRTCGITAAGTAYCWGRRWGSETSVVYAVPVNVSGIIGDKTFKTISAGLENTCGITGDNKAWCWGPGSRGNLGSESSDFAALPVQVDVSHISGDTSFATISTGDNRTCAVTKDGKSWCWGSNEYNGLGNTKVSGISYTPVAVSFEKIPDDSSSDNCALKSFLSRDNGGDEAYVQCRKKDGTLLEGYLSNKTVVKNLHAISFSNRSVFSRLFSINANWDIMKPFYKYKEFTDNYCTQDGHGDYCEAFGSFEARPETVVYYDADCKIEKGILD